MPHPVLWALASLVLLGLAGTALYYATRPDEVIEGLDVALGRAIGEITAAVLAALGLLTVRRFLYDRLARRPGPVEITSFSGDPKTTGVRTEDVLADFRLAMTEMSLSTPEPVPNEPAADGVLDDVRTAFDGQQSPVSAAVLLLVSLVRIRYAYRVSVQLRERRADGECGISVHVSRLPNGSGEVRTIWARGWADAARRAGHVVGAYVVPRSRLSRRPPWRAWRGLEMPSELFHRSQEAAAHIRARRYDEALRVLHALLEDDPQNPYLRIELGQAQEQLVLQRHLVHVGGCSPRRR